MKYINDKTIENYFLTIINSDVLNIIDNFLFPIDLINKDKKIWDNNIKKVNKIIKLVKQIYLTNNGILKDYTEIFTINQYRIHPCWYCDKTHHCLTYCIQYHLDLNFLTNKYRKRIMNF